MNTLSQEIISEIKEQDENFTTATYLRRKFDIKSIIKQ